MGVSLRLRNCATIGSRGGVGPPGDAYEVESEIVDQAKVRAAEDRQMLGQMPVRARAPARSIPQLQHRRRCAERAQGNEHVGPGYPRTHPCVFLDRAPVAAAGAT